MAKQARPSAISSAKSPHTDGDGNQIANEILLGLPLKEPEMLWSKLEFVRLKTHYALHEPGDDLKSVYFCNTGLVSILSVFPDGKSVEVGLVGKEGYVDLPLVAGFRTSSTRTIAQIEGSAFRVDGETLVAILRRAPIWRGNYSNLRKSQPCKLRRLRLAIASMKSMRDWQDGC